MFRSFLVPLLLLMPVIELFGIIFAAAKLGFLATVGWIAVDLVIGVLLIRLSGQRMRSRGMSALNDRAQLAELMNSSAIVVAGILIAIPGFVTDIFGLLILFPPTRRLLARGMLGKVVVTRTDMRTGFSAEFRSTGSGFEQRRNTGGFEKRPSDGVVDLDPEDFRREEEETERKRLHRPDQP